jgi:hypothetical protein
MKIDEKTQTVTRFNVGIGQESFCKISNEDQWNLFMLVVKSGGTVETKCVHRLLPQRSERGNANTRLKEKLSEVQLTLKCEAGKGYVLQEFPG